MPCACVWLLACASLAAACGWAPSPEHQILSNFFRASRLRDTTVLARFAAVTFEPRTDGTVQQFEIVGDGLEQPAASGTISKQVTVEAQVRTPDGQVVPKTLIVTMQRGRGPRPDRWFITAITPLPASRTSPAASSGRPS